MKTVGIIGAGPAGICAVRHVMNSPGLKPVAWEHSAQLGGTWRFNPETGIDKFGYPVHSSMYESLRTDLPIEIMGYPDFPFDKGDLRSFVRHPIVLGYLKEYAHKFGVEEHIKFEHHVEKVEPVKEGSRATAWNVTVKNLKDGSSSSTVCDFIMVCNGHYSDPKFPEISNIEKFKGKALHSHDYRNPKFLQGLRVAVLGAGFSGLDITFDASEVAANVYLCHNLEKQPVVDFPENVTVKPGIKEATENGFICRDGSSIEVDVIIFCTGYVYSFPFLNDSAKITVENQQVKPLYRHIISAAYPTMAFIGIPTYIIHFRNFDFQIRYFLKFCCDKAPMPDEATMKKQVSDLIEEKRAKGMCDGDLHVMKEFSWDYLDQLIEEADLEPFPTIIRNITIDCVQNVYRNMRTFKNNDYKIVDEESFVSSYKELDSD